jgi:phage tail tape-measure protein
MQLPQISDPQDCALALGAGAVLGALNGISHGPAGVAVGSVAGGLAGYASAGACHSANASSAQDGVDVDVRSQHHRQNVIEPQSVTSQTQAAR